MLTVFTLLNNQELIHVRMTKAYAIMWISIEFYLSKSIYKYGKWTIWYVCSILFVCHSHIKLYKYFDYYARMTVHIQKICGKKCGVSTKLIDHLHCLQFVVCQIGILWHRFIDNTTAYLRKIDLLKQFVCFFNSIIFEL